jgi:hypothetical protein
MAVEAGFPRPLNVTTGQALQEALDRAVQLWRFADSQLDLVDMEIDEETGEALGFFEELPGPGGSVVVQPNRWYELAMTARRDVEKLAGMMTQLGIAERHVKVEEARAVLVIAAIKEAAMEAGLDNDTIKLLGEKLRSKLDEAHSDSPDRHTSRKEVGMARSQRGTTSRQVASRGPGH